MSLAAEIGSGRWVWLSAALIVVVGAGVYANSFRGAFVFDDKQAILEKADLWRSSSLLEIIRSQAQTPLVALTLALNYRLGGNNPFGYHLVNLAIHLLAGLTLFGIVRRTLLIADCGLPIADSSSAPFRHPHRQIRNTLLALVVALLWLVHPLQTESVTYIIQRKESLMGLFYLLTIYCLIRGRTAGWIEARADDPSSAARKAGHRPIWRSTQPAVWFWLAASVVSGALGMGTKQVMVTAPVMALLYDRTFLSGSFRKALSRSWVYYLLLVGTWGMLATSFQRYQQEGLGRAEMSLTPLDYALTQFGVILHYLRLSFWPSGLCLDYGWPIARQPGQYALQAIVVLTLAAVTAAAFLWRRRTSPSALSAAGFLGVWFFLTLAPTSSVIVVTEPIAEHRMYLPLAAIAAGAVIGGYVLGKAILRRAANPRIARVPGWLLPALVTAAATGLLGWRTVLRNADYRSQVAIFRSALSVRPNNPRAHYNLACFLAEAGASAGALQEYNLAIQFKADYVSAYLNRGSLQQSLGRPEEAMSDFSKAVDIRPDLPGPYNNRGVLYSSQGRHELAIAEFTKAIEKDQTQPEVYHNRAIAYAALERPAEVIEDCTRAITARKDYFDAYHTRGRTYLKQRRFDRAIEDLTQAIALRNDYPDAYLDRGRAYQGLNRLEAALADFSRAIELRPALAALYNTRGNVYDALGRTDKAIEDYTLAVTLDSAFAEAWYNRGGAYLQAGRHQQAADDYTMVLKLKPQAQAYNNRALAFAQLGRHDRAVQDLNQAVLLQPDYADAYFNRGDEYLLAGQTQQALEDFTRVIQLAGNDAQAYLKRARCQYQLKRYDQAWADVRTCRQLGGKPDGAFIQALSAESKPAE